MIAALTSDGPQLGCAARTSAPMPATCGEAIDVPLRMFGLVPPLDAADEMFVPGAVTSGLIDPSEPCSPRDELGLSVSATVSSCRNVAPLSDGPIRTVSVPAW